MNGVHTLPNNGEQGIVDVPYATQPHLPPDDATSALFSSPLSLVPFTFTFSFSFSLHVSLLSVHDLFDSKSSPKRLKIEFL